MVGRGRSSPRLEPWAWFLAWAVVGGVYGAGVYGAASIGVVAFPVAIVATILLSGRRPGVIGLPGALLGAGAVVAFVAYVNRHGPGLVCSEMPPTGGFRCVHETSPWPWLAGAVAGVVGGLVLFAALRARREA